MGQWNIFGLLGVLFLMRGGWNIDVIDDSSRSGCKSYIFGGYRTYTIYRWKTRIQRFEKNACIYIYIWVSVDSIQREAQKVYYRDIHDKFEKRLNYFLLPKDTLAPGVSIWSPLIEISILFALIVDTPFPWVSPWCPESPLKLSFKQYILWHTQPRIKAKKHAKAQIKATTELSSRNGLNGDRVFFGSIGTATRYLRRKKRGTRKGSVNCRMS